MGLFLSMMACKTTSSDAVLGSLTNVMFERGLTVSSQEQVDGITGQDNEYAVSAPQNRWIQIFTPEAPDSELARDLSRELSCPVFLFHIHDGDLWMYELYDAGELRDCFNQIPEYWEAVDEKEMRRWRGQPELLASMFAVDAAQLRPYLVHASSQAGEAKAFDDDESSVSSEWAMVDFQRRLGIIYPRFGDPGSVTLQRLTFAG